MTLTDKIVLITGASKGLGLQIALRLHRKGAKVILAARSEELLDELARGMEQTTGEKPMTVCCDVAEEDDVTAMSEAVGKRFNRIDVLINNAGIGVYKTVEYLSADEMRKQFSVNMFGAFYCVKALLPLIKKSRSGYILNVGSLFSKTAMADNSIYAATKHALCGFSTGLRREMKKHRIGVGLFLPGPMDTSFQAQRDDAATRAPKALTLHPAKAAAAVEKMIERRKEEVYMYRLMLFLMKLKRDVPHSQSAE